MRAQYHKVLINTGEASIRDALPADLGLIHMEWRTPGLRQDTFTRYIDHSLSNNQVLVMYGVAQEDTDPAATVMKVSQGQNVGMVYSLIELQRLYTRVVIEKGKCRHESMLTEPVWFAPMQHILIDVGARRDKPEGDQLIPLFLVVGPKGTHIVA
jgi:hypothetical protein